MATGDVYTYIPTQHHCREGLAIENDRGRLIDWFWGGHDLSLDNIVDRDADALTFVANLNDYELTPRDGRESNRDYAPADRLVIHSQHGLQLTHYIRKGASPDLSTKIANARIRVAEAESDLRSAESAVKWARKDLEDLERQ